MSAQSMALLSTILTVAHMILKTRVLLQEVLFRVMLPAKML